MDREWHSSTPDGREVVIQRREGVWPVRCGHWWALNGNLDVALMSAIRSDPEIVAHSDEADFAAWARAVADEIGSAA
jgi:hypothetical protein